MVDDNFHYMDESERYCAGEFDSYQEALACAKLIVDECLQTSIEPGKTPDVIYGEYTGFGEDPFIIGDGIEEHPRFSAWEYARVRCNEMYSA